MTCSECEARLAEGKIDGLAEEHLRACAACRALREELRENALALGALRDEMIPKPARGFPWMSAVAAGVVLAIAIPAVWLATRPIPPAPVKATTPAEVTVTASVKAEPLTVKMLTPDPDVVIYWLIDSKEGE
jgi:hypothetical protein